MHIGSAAAVAGVGLHPSCSIGSTCFSGTSLVAHWLILCASNAGGVGLIPGQETKMIGTKMSHAMGPYLLCPILWRSLEDLNLFQRRL